MSRVRRSAARIQSRWGGIALLAVLAACGRRQDAPFRPIGPGDHLPRYDVQSLRGDTVRLGSPGAPGAKATLVNVWATWCTSCGEEMEDLGRLQTQFGARGLAVVAVSVDRGSTARVERYAEERHLGFTVAHDPTGDIQSAFSVPAVPTTYLVGPDGTIAWAHTGNIGPVMAELGAAIARLVPEPAQ